MRKLFNTEIKSIDEDARTVQVVFSTEDVDRDGDVVVQAGWNFEEYSKNPVVLWGHDSSEPPVATTLDINTQGQKSLATMQFAKDDSVAERLWNLVRQGILKTVSAGFINTLREGERLLENTLLEISWVSIPANPNAITLGYESGMIEKEDVDFLQKHYTKQLDILGRGKINKEGGEMDDKLREEVASTVAESIKPLAEKLEEVSTALAESQKPAEGEKEDDTKPSQDGSTNSEESSLSEEEVTEAVAEGVAEALHETG